MREALPWLSRSRLQLLSPALRSRRNIRAKAKIPRRHFRSAVRRRAKSFALILDDPDAPDPRAPKRVWVHWVVYNLPPDTTELAEDASATGLPKGAVTGVNDSNRTSYNGPCPPTGRHRYFHKLYALDTTLPAKALTKADVEGAIKGHVLAQAELIGTYQQGDP